MTYLLQVCGLSDPLQLFYLEQGGGPVFAGFRPFQLDELLGWSQAVAGQRHWDREAIERAVMEAWLERADRLVVAALGTQQDWEQRCEAMLLA